MPHQKSKQKRIGTSYKKLNEIILEGIEVLTIEGLAEKNGELHPIQKSFIEAGAVQCGFCTPGIIMRLYGLFTKNPTAPEEEIREVLSKHLCRCTGYEAIWEVALLAQKELNNYGACL